MSVAVNLSDIISRIDAARARSSLGQAVSLLAVSKGQSLEKISEAIRAGQKDFGENYLQEALGKIPAVESVRWHFIGRLQTKKVRDVVGRFELVHSVDSVKLLDEIDRRARARGLCQPLLIQVNIAGEESKGGVLAEQVYDMARSAAQRSGVILSGLMAMPPPSDNPEECRPYFRRMRLLFDEIRSRMSEEVPAFRVLSMGTSQDFEIAIEEGATMVRVGVGLFGARSQRSKTL